MSKTTRTEITLWTRGGAKCILGVAVALSLIVLLLYGASIRAPFAYDDRIDILENPIVRSFKSLSDIDAIKGAFAGPSGLAGRPLLMVTYGMNYALSGANPTSFRWVNLAVHVVNSVLVFLIVLRIARCDFKVALRRQYLRSGRTSLAR